jgi:hypothetical protein
MKVFISYSVKDKDIATSLVEALISRNMEPIDPMSSIIGGDLLSEISSSVRSADVVIAILSTKTPNVFLELGLAIGSGLPVLIVASPGEALPSDISAIPYVELTGDNSRDAHNILNRLENLHIRERKPPQNFDSAEAKLRAANNDPSFLDSIKPQEFETLIAKLFEEKGFKINPTKETRDSGFDFALESPKHDGVILVEAKKLSSQSKVSVDTVRKLLSAIPIVGATMGILVTTSGYTAAAAALAGASTLLLHSLNDLLDTKTIEDIFKKIKTANKANAADAKSRAAD